jgi:hypothetical protein
MEIQQTMRFSQFKILKGNRAVNEAHLRSLIKSIKNQNRLKNNPIIVNEKMEVIDGQHRLLSAKELETQVYYTVAKEADLETAQLLNLDNRSWGIKDYLESYIKLDRGDYRGLKTFSEKYGISISMSILLLNSNSMKKDSAYMRNFKDGKFIIDSWDEAVDMAEKLNELKPYLENDSIVNDREFVNAIKEVLEIAKIEVLVKRFRTSGTIIERSGWKKNYLRQLEDVYNFGLREKNRIRFY